MAFGHFGVGVGVVKVAVWSMHYMSEILVERKPYFMAVRPRSAYFQASTFGAFLATLHFGWLRAQEHHLSWSFGVSLKVIFSFFLASGQRCFIVHVFAVVWLAVSWVSRCCGGAVGVLAIGMPRGASSEWRGLALEF